MESKSLFKRLAVAAFAGAMVLGVSRMAQADNGAGDGQKVSLKVNLSNGQKWQFSNTKWEDREHERECCGRQRF